MSFDADLSSGWLRLAVIEQMWMVTWEAGVSVRCFNVAEFVGKLLIMNHLGGTGVAWLWRGRVQSRSV